MPLPQQVIEQLGREPTATPGWSSGILLFSGGVLLIMVALYFTLMFGYGPYLSGQISQAEDQASKVGQSISSADQANLVTYYSEVANLHTLVGSHVLFSQFLAWLGDNTEANVFYSNMNFTSGGEVTLAALGKSQADVNQQLEIFQSSPDVQGVAVGNISFSPTAGMWTFNVTLTMKQSIFLWQAASGGVMLPAPTAVPVSASNTATTTP